VSWFVRRGPRFNEDMRSWVGSRGRFVLWAGYAGPETLTHTVAGVLTAVNPDDTLHVTLDDGSPVTWRSPNGAGIISIQAD
jgi:hypothetical protein